MPLLNKHFASSAPSPATRFAKVLPNPFPMGASAGVRPSCFKLRMTQKVVMPSRSTLPFFSVRSNVQFIVVCSRAISFPALSKNRLLGTALRTSGTHCWTKLPHLLWATARTHASRPIRISCSTQTTQNPLNENPLNLDPLIKGKTL